MIKLKLSAIVFVFACAAVAHANVSLPDVISEGMVLQQNQRVPIWGKADPGEPVTVRFGAQSKSTTASSDGEWLIRLDPMKANATPAAMTISGRNTIELKNILIGEVWLVAGQSNMQRLLSETADGEAATAAADHPLIRLFNVSRQVAFKHAPPPLARWLACSPQTVKEFSAAGYYFGVELEKELHVPIGLINSSYGGSQAEAWTPVEYLLASADLKPTVDRTKIWDDERPRVRAEYDEAIKNWRAEADKARAAGARPSPSPAVPDALREYRIAASIYDGMIAPLMPFYIRGAFWYQGESNEARAQQYGILLPTMIKAWRERWAEGDFPFGIVQLPNYRDPKPDPADEPWSFIREAQRRTAIATPNTGLIVTIDIGEAHDIHPKNKLDLGKRMARWALADVYGKKIPKSGPMFREAKATRSGVIIKFDEVGNGLRIRDGKELSEFAIAGEDRKWYWANAKIVGKDTIQVWSDSVKQPIAVRYAFNNNPRNPNLTNDTGLPAAPFRTDNWPGPTDGKR
ncbi:MAG TPA: sialate O-acetylesterase [Pyrinomonadaceae bacterium]|jgi:sialate O-acetylesterase|nr:sialate O-acetylesterase [Pyrinomonadaceae bacterium]